MSTETEAAPQTWEKSYDLYLLATGKRFSFRNEDHGITLTDWELRWTANGKPDYAPLENIAQVRLQSGGDWKNPMNQCQITFRDGYLLSVTDGNDRGIVDDAQTAIYRDFVRALHARLALAPQGTIAFVRGLPNMNFYVVTVAAIVLVLICFVTPLVLWFLTGEAKAFFIVLAGSALCWPLYKMVSNNVPQPYDPKELPQELME